MSIRRRTFFGQIGNSELKNIARVCPTDQIIENIEYQARFWGDNPVISVELLEANCREREMRMAAAAELKRRKRCAENKLVIRRERLRG